MAAPRPLALPLCLIVVGCTQGSGVRLGGDEQAILGGERATSSEVRATVAVALAGAATPSAFCTGALIAPDLVATAAHCALEFERETGAILGDRSPASIMVVAGATNVALARAEQRFAVVDVLVHPRFLVDPFTDRAAEFGALHDIALLTLARPVQTLTPATVLHPDAVEELLELGSELLIEGYGAADREGLSGGGVLRTALVPLLRVGADEFIAGESGTPDTCPGDSGGPVYLEQGGETLLVGLTSRGTPGASSACGQGGIYTLVSAYLDFMGEEVSEASDQSEPGAEGEPRDTDESDGREGDDSDDDNADEVDPSSAGTAVPSTASSADDVRGANVMRGGCSAAQPAGGGAAPIVTALGLLALALRRRR